MAALSAANPIAGYTVKGVQTVYGLSLWREVLFPAGTDIQVQVVRASMLKQKDSWPGWPRLPVDAPAPATGHDSTDAHPHSEQNAFGRDQSHVHRLTEGIDCRVSGRQMV
jgi:hypothetical protein